MSRADDAVTTLERQAGEGVHGAGEYLQRIRAAGGVTAADIERIELHELDPSGYQTVADIKAEVERAVGLHRLMDELDE